MINTEKTLVKLPEWMWRRLIYFSEELGESEMEALKTLVSIGDLVLGEGLRGKEITATNPKTGETQKYNFEGFRKKGRVM